VSDYLGQLTLRVQQPEFAVQPRPLSQFESPRHATLVAPEPPAPGEGDEPGSPSAVTMSADTGARKPTQQADSRNDNASEALDFLSAARSTKESHTSYPGQSTAAPSIVTPAISIEAMHQPLPEVEHPTLNRRSAEPSERIARSPVEQAQPPVRIDKSAEQAGMASSDSWGRRGSAALNGPAVRGEREPIRPLVKIANPEEARESPLSLRAIYHGATGVESEPSEVDPLFGRRADLMPKSGVDSMPGREIFTPPAEPTAPQGAAERVADAPTIQVTIGRVEIRATVAPTPARKPPAQAPVMSLDEYLRQRNGGRG
jgi:hypothetical protein